MHNTQIMNKVLFFRIIGDELVRRGHNVTQVKSRLLIFSPTTSNVYHLRQSLCMKFLIKVRFLQTNSQNNLDTRYTSHLFKSVEN